MTDQQSNDAYPEEEAQRRFEAAIRGARIVGHREMKDIPRKPRAKPRRGNVAARQTPKRAAKKMGE